MFFYHLIVNKSQKLHFACLDLISIKHYIKHKKLSSNGWIFHKYFVLQLEITQKQIRYWDHANSTVSNTAWEKSGSNLTYICPVMIVQLSQNTGWKTMAFINYIYRHHIIVFLPRLFASELHSSSSMRESHGERVRKWSICSKADSTNTRVRPKGRGLHPAASKKPVKASNDGYLLLHIVSQSHTHIFKDFPFGSQWFL